MEAGTGQLTCVACGHVSAPGTRFCTRCGIQLPLDADRPTAPQPQHASAVPSVPADPQPSGQHAQPRWKLDTPPANERWWRNPVVIVIALVTALGGGGVASWQFFIRSSSSVMALHALPQASRTTARTSAPAAPAVDEAAFAGQIDDILQQSHAGIHAARGEHDYATALRNRRRLVAALDRLDVTGQAAPLAAAYATLHDALAASARADASHLACGCDDTLPDDVAATRLKRRFAAELNPYAQRYAGHAVDPDRI